MGVLDTFYILFKSDANEAAAGMEKMDAAADKVEASLESVDKALNEAKTSAKGVSDGLAGAGAAAAKTSNETRRVGTEAGRAQRGARGVEQGMKGAAVGANAAAGATARVATATAAADANAKRLAASFMSVARAAAAPLLGLLSVGAVSSIVSGRAANIRELDAFSVKLNSTVQDVDAFQRSVQELGGEGAAALDSMVKMGEKLNEAFSDAESGAAKDFKAWGLSFKDTEGNALGASAAMVELAGNIENLSQAEALARIKKLGIEDKATIELLMMGKAAVEDYMQSQKDMGVVTQEQADIVRDYYQELGSFNNRLTGVGNALVQMLLPGMSRGIRMLSDALGWMANNRRLVEGFFVGVATAITAYFLPALVRAAIAVAAATWPFLLIGAAAAAVGTAFALAYEDVRAFMDGQPSLIGELAARYEWFAEVVRGIGEVFKWLAGEWETFKADLVALGAEIQAVFESLLRIARGVAEEWGPIFAPLGDAFETLVKSVRDIVEAFSGIVGAAKDVGSEATPVMEGLRDLMAALEPLAEAVGNTIRTVVGGAVTVVSAAIKGLAGAIDVVREAIVGLMALAGSVTIGSGIGTGLADPGGIAGSGVSRAAAGGAAVGAMIGQGKAALGSAAGAPQSLAVPGGGKGDRVTNNNVTVGDINVTTRATDPNEVARVVNSRIKDAFRDATSQFDDGVAR